MSSVRFELLRSAGMEHSHDIDALSEVDLFQGASSEALHDVQGAGFRKRMAAGEALFRQGDAASSLFLVLSGRLRATQTTSDGQQVIIRYLGPGEIAGYTALAGGEVHPGTVTAVDDSQLIGQRYHEMQVRLLELSTARVERRIGHTLLRLAHQAGRRTARGIEIAFPLSRQDVAEMCGTTLHTVSRTLSAWEDQGIVDCGRRRVVVCKPQALIADPDE
jgi:CRP-like cAMP-binding protein